MRKVSATAILEVSDLGDAEKLLKNPCHLREAAHEFLKRGSVPTEAGWGGWMGRYQKALSEVAANRVIFSRVQQVTRQRGRRRPEQELGR